MCPCSAANAAELFVLHECGSGRDQDRSLKTLRPLCSLWCHRLTDRGSRLTVYIALAHDSLAYVIDSFTRATPSFTSAIDSFPRVSQVTPIQSTGPFTYANESIASLIDSIEAASEVTQNQSSSCCQLSKWRLTLAESIIRSREGGRGYPSPVRCTLHPVTYPGTPRFRRASTTITRISS